MGIEINRARVVDGEVRCEVVFPNIGSFVRGLNEVLRIEAEAYEAARVSAEEQRYQAHVQMERDAREARRVAAEQATGQRIPRATMPPYVQYPECPQLGGQPLPEHVEALMATQVEEPEGLKAGEAFTADEMKPGLTD